jgi:hypothetical protein
VCNIHYTFLKIWVANIVFFNAEFSKIRIL